MTDREKVMAELTGLQLWLKGQVLLVPGHEDWQNALTVCTNALELLKEHGAEMIKCKNCMNEINKNDWNFCPYCGKCLPHLEGADDE